MSTRQFFGWTVSDQAAPNEYVQFISANRHADGTVDVSVRNSQGVINTINMSRDAALDFGVALVKELF